MDRQIDRRLQEVISSAYENAPAWKRHFDEAGVSPDDIRSVADLEKVPVLSKDRVVELQQQDPPLGGLLAVPLSEVPRVFFSPGPLYEAGGIEDESVLEMTRIALERSGFEPGEVVLNSLSYHLVPAGLLLDTVLTAMGCTVIPGGTGSADLQLKMAMDFGATGYVGTPSFLMSLIEKAEAAGLTVGEQFRIDKAMTTAEPLFPETRARLVDEYGIAIGNAYATAEIGFMAVNTEGGMAMQLLPEPIVQVVDPDTGKTVGSGEAGEVVVTRFDTVYPLIRLGTGDMAINVDPAPGESSQEQRAIILVGRSGEAVKVRGMFVHPNQLRHAVNSVVEAAGVQGVVTRQGNRDKLTVRIAPAGDTPDLDALREPLTGAIRQICRVGVDEIVLVDALPDGARGMVDERAYGT